MALKYIIYLSVEQFKEIKTNGSVVVNGQTIVDSPDNDYRVPDETQEQIADLQAEQAVQSAKITTLQSAVDNLVLEEVYPLYSKEGNPVNSRYVQFPDQPEPAEIFGGQWELDEDAMDKFLVGAGNLYALGTTGGSAEHLHTLESGYARISPRTSGWSYYQLTEAPGGWVPTHVSRDADLYEEFDEYGVSGAVKLGGTTDATSTIPPYLAVNIWKRTA